MQEHKKETENAELTYTIYTTRFIQLPLPFPLFHDYYPSLWPSFPHPIIKSTLRLTAESTLMKNYMKLTMNRTVSSCPSNSITLIIEGVTLALSVFSSAVSGDTKACSSWEQEYQLCTTMKSQ